MTSQTTDYTGRHWWQLFIGKVGLAKAMLGGGGGHTRFYCRVPVRVVGARKTFGRVEVQVQPIDGEGRVWINICNIQVPDPPHPGDELDDTLQRSGRIAEAAAAGQAWAKALMKRYKELAAKAKAKAKPFKPYGFMLKRKRKRKPKEGTP